MDVSGDRWPHPAFENTPTEKDQQKTQWKSKSHEKMSLESIEEMTLPDNSKRSLRCLERAGVYVCRMLRFSYQMEKLSGLWKKLCFTMFLL